MAVPERELTPLPAREVMTPDQIDLIKRTVAKGCTNDELALFLHAARRTGLDPLMRQIYAVKRWSKAEGREVMSIQTGIDGLRLVAERTKRYSPGREPSFTVDEKGIVAATAYIKKQTEDGTWHEVSASAYWSEYVQTGKDGKPTRFWSQMPHVMLAKVAEALALRRAFPMELSGVYTADEMAQADSSPAVEAEVVPEAEKIAPAAADTLIAALLEADVSLDAACKRYKVNSLVDLNVEQEKDAWERLRKQKEKPARGAAA